MDQNLDIGDMNLEQVFIALSEAKLKLQSAFRQITHLDNQISYLRKLFRRAEKNKGYAVRYNLRMQLSIISGVKVMYHHFAAMKEERISRLRSRANALTNPVLNAEEILGQRANS